MALTPEQRELRELSREFAAKEIRPKAAEYDEHDSVLTLDSPGEIQAR